MRRSSTYKPETIAGKHFDEDTIKAANLVKKVLSADFSSNIRLSVACENIPKCDSLVVVLMFKEDDFVEIGRSELVKTSTNPKYIKNFVVAYKMELTVRMRFEVHF
jgi:hypothetical protein